MRGLVLGGSNNVFSVECDDGVIRQCSLKGKKLKAAEGMYNPLAPGDLVLVEQDSHSRGQAQVLDLLPRKNVFVRWNVKGRSPQLLAANLDYVLCVTTPDSPPFRPRFVDRMLVQCEADDLEPVIVCNKCDLPTDADTDCRLEDWRTTGYRVLRVSAKTGQGMEELSALLYGRFSAFVGQSGVGKSSIINALDPSIDLKTGELCEKYDRGRHTTTRGTLLRPELKCAFGNGDTADGESVRTQVIDTPGIRRFVPHGIASADLPLYFKEMAPLVGSCSFGMSCSHTHEAGCKILEAVHAGVISEERYESWRRMSDELETGSWDDT